MTEPTPPDRREFRFWRSVTARYLIILLVGLLTILWFQGCLVPTAREEMQLNQQKAADTATPSQ